MKKFICLDLVTEDLYSETKLLPSFLNPKYFVKVKWYLEMLQQALNCTQANPSSTMAYPYTLNPFFHHCHEAPLVKKQREDHRAEGAVGLPLASAGIGPLRWLAGTSVAAHHWSSSQKAHFVLRMKKAPGKHQ
jgi:hypothetical protein